MDYICATVGPTAYSQMRTNRKQVNSLFVTQYATGDTAVRANANNCRHVVIRTLSLRNVFFGKAIFTRHPDLLQGVLGEFPRNGRRFVLHSVLL